MTNNFVLRSLRYTFQIGDSQMIALFGAAGYQVTRQQVSDMLKKEDDPAYQKCWDAELAVFLNGFISWKRQQTEHQSPSPQRKPEQHLTNNIILRKLKIALDLKDEEILEILTLAGLPVSKPELSAFFRKPGHKNYRACKDQILRNFLKGLQLKYRPESNHNSDFKWKMKK
ncbi:DUF1456 family protein [Desulfopila inferna]|uniref:DUF1456 family protein n=1 Tax=Desulfopila inferna TaxID=468528 RepID=UPI00196460C0|nr:DUF1456 family protein [Desulfopila inferna]MBM9605295.1 DUF1456 family protein [Desulfopila inferna]